MHGIWGNIQKSDVLHCPCYVIFYFLSVVGQYRSYVLGMSTLHPYCKNYAIVGVYISFKVMG